MKNPNLIGTVYKTDTEDFDIAAVFTNWLTSGDTIASATATCYLGATNVSSAMIGDVTNDASATVTVQVRAGTTGNQYLVSVVAVTVAGDTWEALINLVVN